MKVFRYYVTQRPPMIGTVPRNGIVEVKAFPSRILVSSIRRMAYGYVEYDRELSDEEIADYELTKARSDKKQKRG